MHLLQQPYLVAALPLPLVPGVSCERDRNADDDENDFTDWLLRKQRSHRLDDPQSGGVQSADDPAAHWGSAFPQEHQEGIQEFLERKKMQNLKELEAKSKK